MMFLKVTETNITKEENKKIKKYLKCSTKCGLPEQTDDCPNSILMKTKA